MRTLAARVRALGYGRRSDAERFVVEKLTLAAELDRLARALEADG